MSINITISDDVSTSSVTMKKPINNDIFEYMAVVGDCLKGLSFNRETIYEGFKDWCINYEKTNDNS